MLRAQIGQCAVFNTPTKLQHPYCNSCDAIAIGKLDLVLDRRNVSLFRDAATKPIFTPRISQPLNIEHSASYLFSDLTNMISNLLNFVNYARIRKPVEEGELDQLIMGINGI